MNNVMMPPGQAGARVSNGLQAAGNAPAPANPFAAFIQSILGSFIGGAAAAPGAVTVPGTTTALPGIFAGLSPRAAGRPSDNGAAPRETGDERSSPADDAGVVTPGQIALISAFAPPSAPVMPVADPGNGSTDAPVEGDATAPAGKPASDTGAPPPLSPGVSIADEGVLIASLVKNVIPPGQAVNVPLAGPGDDSQASPAVAPGVFQAPAREEKDAAPPVPPAPLVLPESLSQVAPAPAPVTVQKPGTTPAQQESTGVSPAPARIAEVPIPGVQGDSPVQNVVAAPRETRAPGTGGGARRAAKSVDQPAAERDGGDEPAAPRDIPETLSGPRDVQAPPSDRRSAGGDAPPQGTAVSPAPETESGQSGDVTPAAPAATGENAREVSHPDEPAALNATVTSQATPARNATQIVPVPVDVAVRPESNSPAAPRQEIPSAYAPLPQEVSRRIADQVVRNLTFQVDGTASEMRMTLKPPSLGEVQLRVHVEDSRMVAQIDVSQQLVKSALEAHMPQLRQALQEHGIEVQRIDVMVPEQSMQQESGGSGGERTGRRGGRRAAASIDDEPVQAVKDMGYNTIELIM